MSVESVNERFLKLRTTVGARPLNALFPNDIELYVVSLDLVNSNNETEDYFVFPINPASISEGNTPIQTIKKTAGGITKMGTLTHSPNDISLQGNFGRKFKFLLGSEVINFSAIRIKNNVTKSQSIGQEFDSKIKTGYGCLKVLESIVKKSQTLDANGKPYALYFYNLALGNSYLVSVTGFTPYQGLDTNIVWSYNLQMKTLIPVENILRVNKASLTGILSANEAVQNTVNNIGNAIGRLKI